jgi:hypothetical protein
MAISSGSFIFGKQFDVGSVRSYAIFCPDNKSNRVTTAIVTIHRHVAVAA